MSGIVRNEGGESEASVFVEFENLRETGLVLVQVGQGKVTLKAGKSDQVGSCALGDSDIVTLRVHLQKWTAELVFRVQSWEHGVKCLRCDIDPPLHRI